MYKTTPEILFSLTDKPPLCPQGEGWCQVGTTPLGDPICCPCGYDYDSIDGCTPPDSSSSGSPSGSSSTGEPDECYGSFCFYTLSEAGADWQESQNFCYSGDCECTPVSDLPPPTQDELSAGLREYWCRKPPPPSSSSTTSGCVVGNNECPERQKCCNGTCVEETDPCYCWECPGIPGVVCDDNYRTEAPVDGDWECDLAGGKYPTAQECNDNCEKSSSPTEENSSPTQGSSPSGSSSTGEPDECFYLPPDCGPGECLCVDRPPEWEGGLPYDANDKASCDAWIAANPNPPCATCQCPPGCDSGCLLLPNGADPESFKAIICEDQTPVDVDHPCDPSFDCAGYFCCCGGSPPSSSNSECPEGEACGDTFYGECALDSEGGCRQTVIDYICIGGECVAEERTPGCDPEACPPPPTGACCTGPANCEIATQFQCEVNGWKWLGAGSICDDCFAPPETGACCNATTGFCFESMYSECPDQWLGAGSTCVGDCPQPPPPSSSTGGGTWHCVSATKCEEGSTWPYDDEISCLDGANHDCGCPTITCPDPEYGPCDPDFCTRQVFTRPCILDENSQPFCTGDMQIESCEDCCIQGEGNECAEPYEGECLPKGSYGYLNYAHGSFDASFLDSLAAGDLLAAMGGGCEREWIHHICREGDCVEIRDTISCDCPPAPCSPPCASCQKCEDGTCKNDCPPCQVCTPDVGVGADHHECMPVACGPCETCGGPENKCATTCNKCQTCEEGECKTTKTCDPCFNCDPETGDCVPLCSPCEQCSPTDGGHECVPKPCGPCEVCVSGTCTFACGPCEKCNGASCVSLCKGQQTCFGGQCKQCYPPPLPPPSEPLMCPDGTQYGLKLYTFWDPFGCAYQQQEFIWGDCSGTGGGPSSDSGGGGEPSSTCCDQANDHTSPEHEFVCGYPVPVKVGGGLPSTCFGFYAEYEWCDTCLDGIPVLKDTKFFFFNRESCGFEPSPNNGVGPPLPCPQSSSSESSSSSEPSSSSSSSSEEPSSSSSSSSDAADDSSSSSSSTTPSSSTEASSSTIEPSSSSTEASSSTIETSSSSTEASSSTIEPSSSSTGASSSTIETSSSTEESSSISELISSSSSSYPDGLLLVYDTINEPSDGTISLPLSGTVDVLVEWGDGTFNNYTTSGFKTHTYASPGIYTVHVSGTMTSLDHGTGDQFQNNKLKLVRCLSFGNIGIINMLRAFRGCSNLIEAPYQLPSGVTNCSEMFHSCTSFNDHRVAMWDVSSVANMRNMFRGCQQFDADLSSWNTASATNMAGMFYDCPSFNSDLSSWNTGSVLNMSSMFFNSDAYDCNMASWNLSSLSVSFSLDEFMSDSMGLSTANYEATLIGWNASKASYRSDLSPNFGGSKYTCGSAAEAARAALVAYGWTITDGGCVTPMVRKTPNVFHMYAKKDGATDLRVKGGLSDHGRREMCMCDHFSGPLPSNKGSHECSECIQVWECDHLHGPRPAGYYSLNGTSEFDVTNQCFPVGYECDSDVGAAPIYRFENKGKHEAMGMADACLPRYGCDEKEGCVFIGHRTNGYLEDECESICIRRFEKIGSECSPHGFGTFGMSEDDCNRAP